MACALFREIGLGSKKLLGRPSFLVTDQLWKTNYCQQQLFKFHTPTATKRLHGKVSQFFPHWNLGKWGYGLLFRHKLLGKGYKFTASSIAAESCDVEKTLKKMRARHIMLIATVAIGALMTATYISCTEMIPYSKRRHFVIYPKWVEKELGQCHFQMVKMGNKEKMLPYDHPMSVRVRSIKNRLIEALERDLKDDKSYLDYIHEWEILVIDVPDNHGACSGFGGKIYIFSGLFNTLESDAEIAYVIAHEIGHGVGRHQAEKMTRLSILSFGESLYMDFGVVIPSFLSLSRKLELEADYIGILLMASAGYDPSVAQKILENIAELSEDESESTHPSGRRRVELAAQTQEEAMAFYKASLNYTVSNTSGDKNSALKLAQGSTSH